MNSRVKYITGLSLLVLLLSACSQEEPSSQEKTSEEKNLTPSETVEVAVLKIDHGCIGCGRCVNYSSEHFTMSGRHAKVISQKNLDSSDLKSAINACPVNVISLI